MTSLLSHLFWKESANTSKKDLWWGKLIKKRKQLDNTCASECAFFREQGRGISDSVVGGSAVRYLLSLAERGDLPCLCMCLGRAAEDNERNQGCYAKRGDGGSHRKSGHGATEANQSGSWTPVRLSENVQKFALTRAITVPGFNIANHYLPAD